MFERRERDASSATDDLWDHLPVPWRACVELAWEAYGAGSLPIGAVVADAEGNVISRGRNRIHERSGADGYLFGHKLAHAELNALVTLDHDGHDKSSCTLYTTTEPCPLCVGAVRMSDVGGVRFAAREPWGGSTAMFETVPYLKRGRVRVEGPEDEFLEDVLAALLIVCFLRLKPKILGRFLTTYGALLPRAVAAGRRLYRSGALARVDGADTPGMLSVVQNELRSGV
jgi:tRNA(adenine34) deaminase